MSGLRLLLLGPYPIRPEKVIGGVKSVTSTLAFALSSLPDVAKVTVLNMFHGPYQARTENITDKLEVIHIPGQNKLALPTRGFLEFGHAQQLANMIRPDIVHGQGLGFMGDFATRLGPRSFVTVHGLAHIEAKMAAKGIVGRMRVHLVTEMVKDVLRKANAVISTSNYDGRETSKWIRGRHVVIPNPVSPEFFAPYENSMEGCRFLFAGMLIKRKNVVGLLRAFSEVVASVPNALLVIAGPQPDPTYAREVVEAARYLRLERHIRWLGHISNQSLLNEIRHTKALLIFSWEETSPTIIAQSMAVGIPIISSRVEGISEMIDDGVSGFMSWGLKGLTRKDRLFV